MLDFGRPDELADESHPLTNRTKVVPGINFAPGLKTTFGLDAADDRQGIVLALLREDRVDVARDVLELVAILAVLRKVDLLLRAPKFHHELLEALIDVGAALVQELELPILEVLTLKVVDLLAHDLEPLFAVGLRSFCTLG